MKPDDELREVSEHGITVMYELEREHAAVVRWLAAKDATKEARLAPHISDIKKLIGPRISCEQEALANLETVAREVRECER